MYLTSTAACRNRRVVENTRKDYDKQTAGFARQKSARCVNIFEISSMDVVNFVGGKATGKDTSFAAAVLAVEQALSEGIHIKEEHFPSPTP